MTEFKNPEDMTIPELCERFEADIRSGCHSFRAEYSRSPARKELENRIFTHTSVVLPQAIRYLRLDSRNLSEEAGAMSESVIKAWSLIFLTFGDKLLAAS